MVKAVETKLKLKPNEGTNRKCRACNQIQSTFFAFIAMEFNSEPSGHRRTSQCTKVHDDSETSPDPVHSLRRLFILSGPFLTRGLQPPLHSPSAAEELLFFCFYWQLEAVWMQRDGQSGEISEYKASRKTYRRCFIRTSWVTSALSYRLT